MEYISKREAQEVVMRRTRRVMTVGVALTLAAVGSVLATSGSAVGVQNARHTTLTDAHAGGLVLSAALAPSALPTDPAIFGVAPGGVPWQISAGHALLSQGGT